MTEKTETHCDLCYALDPPVVWQVANGGAVEVWGLNPETGESIPTVSDTDGLWATCKACDEQIRTFLASKKDGSALRRFAKNLWERSAGPVLADVPESQRSRAAKMIREQQMALYKELIPQLTNPRPIAEVPKNAPPVRRQPSEFALGDIPDGATRTRRLL